MQPGVYPASVTPFDDKGRVDLPGVARLLAYFAAHGCKGAVLAGTNGEGPSLSAAEKRDLIRAAAPLGKSLGLEIILGIATPSLDEAIWLTRQAADAEAVLVMPPGYFREASEEGIEQWFLRVLDASPVPVLVYNFPKRTAVTITAELLKKLSGHERYLGAKDSSGEAENLRTYREATPDHLLYVGDETLLWQATQAGWTGTISGAANVLPQWLAATLADEDRESAETKFELILPALKALRGLPQPAGNKAILHRLGILDSAEVRLPLMCLDQGALDRVLPLLPICDPGESATV